MAGSLRCTTETDPTLLSNYTTKKKKTRSSACPALQKSPRGCSDTPVCCWRGGLFPFHKRRKPGQRGPSCAKLPASQGGAGFLPLPGCCPCWEGNSLPHGDPARVQGVTSSGTLPGWEGRSAPQGFLLFSVHASHSRGSPGRGSSGGASPGDSANPQGSSHLQQVCGRSPSCRVCRMPPWMTGILS